MRICPKLHINKTSRYNNRYMETNSPHFKNKYEICIYGILIISAIMAALLAVKNIKLSPDAMRFGLISQQILSGNGIRVPVIRLEDTYVPVNGAIPFLDQMPLLPILFAMLGGLTPQSYLAAQIINAICHVVISIFTFLLMKNLCNKGMALLTGLLVSFSYQMLWLANHIISDSLLIALIMAAIYFLTLSRNTIGKQFNRSLFAAGICAGAAILARNAGIALIPAFLWEVFILLKNKSPKSRYVPVILATTIPAITTVAMFVRNYVISGTLRGFNHASIERSYSEAVKGTLEMIFLQFNLGKNYITLIVLSMTVLILYVLINSKARKEILIFFSSGLDLIIVFIVSYTALICLTMAKQQWRYELRYVYPLVPFLFIICILIIVFVWKSIKAKGFLKLSSVGIILSLSLITSDSFYKTFLNFSEFSDNQDKAYFILNSCTYKWIKENYGGNTVIVTNRPFHLSFFGGYTTVALPHKRFEPTIHIPDDMETILPNQMSKFGSRVLALFEEAEEQYEGRYIARLFSKRENNDRFTLIHECQDGVVYNLKE